MSAHQLLVAILESSASLAIFSLIYLLVLRNLTHFQWTRIYLIGSLVMSIAIGFFNVELVNEIVIPSIEIQQTNLSEFPENVVSGEGLMQATNTLQWMEVLELLLVFLLGIGAIFFGLRFLFAFFQSIKMTRLSEEIETGIRTSNRFSGAFSFFKTVFVPSHFLELSPKDFSIVLDHERAHIKYHHTVDLLLLEGFKTVFWFNPIYWWLAQEIKLVHEYQVDAEVKDSIDAGRYAELLIQLSTKKPQPLFVQPFSMQSLSSRIKKMHQLKSSPLKKFYYVLAIPTVVLLLQSFSIEHVEKLVFENAEVAPTTEPSFTTPIRENQLTRVVPFGHREHPINSKRKLHKGIDFVAPMGVDVLAAANGEVLAIQHSGQGYGNQIKIEHSNGYVTSYSHLKEIKVEEGQKVLMGDVIASNGSTGMSTGPHCHFELLLNDTAINPWKYLRADLTDFLVESDKRKEVFTVYLDAGHGGEDLGYTIDGVSEKEINATLAKKLEKQLLEENIRVVLTRNEDATVRLKERVEMAESVENSVFISIHSNSAPSESTNGIEFYIPQASHPMAAKSEKLVKLLHAKFDEAGLEVRATKTANFYVLKHAKVPTVMIEAGFMSNSSDLKMMQQEDYQNLIAKEIANSIKLYKL